MNLIYFLRLLYKRTGLIAGVAILMAGLACLLTRGQKKMYTAYSTICTGIVTDHNMESGVNTRLDEPADPARFDNLIHIISSRETQEKTAIRLIAQHLMLNGPDPEYCMPETWQALMLAIPAEIKADRDSGDYQARYDRLVHTLTEYKKTNHDNYIYKTLQSSNPYYGVKKISTVKVARIKNSDLLKLSFDSGDPAVCVQTLKILIDVSRSQYQEIMDIQNRPATEYFRLRADASKKQLDSLEQDLLAFRMKNRILNYYEQTKCITEQKELLDKAWYEEAGTYAAITSRKIAFLKKYDELVLLGNQLKKMELGINLAQQNYLSQLNNQNQCILRQKIITQSGIQIIDNPILPVKPNASKRIIAVIAAFVAGLVLTASLIILLELLDTRIKFPQRLEEQSGLKLLGAFPLIAQNPDNRVNYALLASRAIDRISQRITLENLRQNPRGDRPFILFVVSTRVDEGKTYVATRLVEKLRTSGSKVLYVKPLEIYSPDELKRRFSRFDQPQQAWDFEYAIPDNFISIRNINELLRNYAFLTRGYHYLVIELPALLLGEYPAAMIRSGNLSILVASAARTWSQADDEALHLYQSSVDHPVLSVLNRCRVDRSGYWNL